MNKIRIKALLLLSLLSQCSVYKKNHMHEQSQSDTDDENHMYAQSQPGSYGTGCSLKFLSSLQKEHKAKRKVSWPDKYLDFLCYIGTLKDKELAPYNFFKIMGTYHSEDRSKLFLADLEKYQDSLVHVLKDTIDSKVQEKIEKILTHPWCIGYNNSTYYYIELKEKYKHLDKITVYKYEYGLDLLTVLTSDILNIKEDLIANFSLSNSYN